MPAAGIVPLSHTPIELWIGFTGLFALLLFIDLWWCGRHSGPVPMKSAAIWTAIWVTMALVFGGFVYAREGPVRALEYVSGYLIEYSLSVDNLFVFIMIFSFFGVSLSAQPRVLKWGIFGAILLRALFIAVGAAILNRFEGAIYVFGAFLIWTGVKMARSGGDDEIHPDRNIFVRLARRFLPISVAYDGHYFTTRQGGRLMLTPLFIVLLVIESTDVIFALDSIPAIYGVTNDPFIVYSSNVFAIMGLRSLFFLLAGAMGLFRYLKTGVAAVLVFVGGKMLVSGYAHISIQASLAVVFFTLAGSIVASLAMNYHDRSKSSGDPKVTDDAGSDKESLE